MSRSLGSPSLPGGPTRGPSDRISKTWVLLATLVVVAGTAGFLAMVVPGTTASSPSPTASIASAPPIVPSADPATHGDLVVGAGQTYVIQPTLGGHTYYQGGNITVESGGTLWVRNVTLSFVQFVGDSGTAAQRLGHIYHFVDQGTVGFYNSTLTTDVQVINTYAKLNLTVTGSLTAWQSTFAFPGWFFISGSSADVTLNASTITSNAAVQGLSEPTTILWDTSYAPTVSVRGGAQLNLFGSQIQNLYSDNLLANGYPRPAPLTAPVGLLPSGGVTSALTGSNDSTNLTLAWSYPTATAVSGYVGITYTDLNGPGPGPLSNNTNASVNVSYGGTSYALGTVHFLNGTSSTLYLPFTPALLAAISQGGMLQYLNYTGLYDTPAEINVSVSNVVGNVGTPSSMIAFSLEFQLNTSGPAYNLEVSASTLTAVDASLDLNWNPVGGGGIYAPTTPYPWSSSKLNFTAGAVGYLANITTPNALPGVFSTSAILPDASSQVYFYRWAQIGVTGANSLPLQGAQVSAFYAYDTNQANNATVTALNDIATADPAMWGYLQYWDAAHGASGWGISNAAGVASLLLASGNLTYSTLPDGIFLGGYHIQVSVPGATFASHWFNWSVSPYPTGVAVGTANWGQPDVGPSQNFPGYSFSIRVVSATGPSSTSLKANQQYASTVKLAYNGSQTASVTIYAVSGAGSIVVGSGSGTNSTPFTVAWSTLQLKAGTSYTLEVYASANGVSSPAYRIPGTYTIPTPAPAKNFFTESFFGLPFWLWLAIAAAIVIGIAAFLLLARRQAAGKLVECGECGNLIPEDATVCPKCGAEFEKDLVRCSRCASTIPAESKYCPECAAQLLGKPGETGEEAERQGYADFTEKFRAEAKRELGENYSEGGFWDWWKRQPTYTSYGQWKLQQGQGTPRVGMSVPPAGAQAAPEGAPSAWPRGRAPGAPPSPSAVPPPAPPAATAMPPEPAAPPAANLRACPNCGKEIPPDYLVCPFCGAVTE